MNFKPFFAGLSVLALCGCVYVGHYSQVMELREFDKAQTELDRYVEQEENGFYLLLEDIEYHRLAPGKTKKQVLSKYGDPVFCKQNSCLYRLPLEYFDTQKVYLEFDPDERLLSWRVEPAD